MSAEPIKLKDYDFHGFAMNGALAGEEVQVAHRAMLTSDSPAFYVFMRGVCDSLADAAHAAGVLIQPDHVSHLLLVIHTGRTADLYLGNFAMTLELMAKKDITAGQAVSEADIADIRRLRLHDVKLDPSDKVLICFKVNWKFGLYFDLGDEEPLDMNGLERDLGHLYRLLRFEAAYDALADENFVARFFAGGWFPFVEIFGPESERLLKAWRLDFNIAGEEEALLRRFDAARIDAIAARWAAHPTLGPHAAVLNSGLEAFKRGDAVASLKVILTEIEGVLRNAHMAENGASAKIGQLLAFAAQRGLRKTESEASLFFPALFLRYLTTSTFAAFDPMAPTSDASRHSVGHGAANAGAYTQKRALQAILTLDQIARYL
ncbi:hypothetical protein U91I_01013 [alpha proteobacterium U9-1i]|nr:hypothetical protein U91I_01013 [alpha proteobacterium U9-1i]